MAKPTVSSPAKPTASSPLKNLATEASASKPKKASQKKKATKEVEPTPEAVAGTQQEVVDLVAGPSADTNEKDAAVTELAVTKVEGGRVAKKRKVRWEHGRARSMRELRSGVRLGRFWGNKRFYTAAKQILAEVSKELDEPVPKLSDTACKAMQHEFERRVFDLIESIGTYMKSSSSNARIVYAPHIETVLELSKGR